MPQRYEGLPISAQEALREADEQFASDAAKAHQNSKPLVEKWNREFSLRLNAQPRRPQEAEPSI